VSPWIARSISRVFAVLVACGLTFGSAAALAVPSTASSCPVNPDSSQYGYACTSHASCTQSCSAYYGFRSEGRCYNGCCTCLL